MTKPIYIHGILIQAEKEGFLEEVAFKLTPAGLRTQDGGWSMGDRGRHSWLMVHTVEEG